MNEKESLEYAAQLALTASDKRYMEKDGRIYIVDRDGDVSEYRPNDTANQSLQVHTLDALLGYIKDVAERHDSLLVLQVADEDHVNLYGELDKYGRRELLMEARAMHANFTFDRFMGQQNFVIAVQSMFVPSETRNVLLKLVSNLKEEQGQTAVDDGTSQTVTARTGVTSVEQVKIPNPLSLAPYRTFVEVEQPSSDFVFRLDSGMSAGLFEADGGQWRLAAVQNIADYLRAGLVESGNDKRVTVLA